jgi:hypothetical protein
VTPPLPDLPPRRSELLALALTPIVPALGALLPGGRWLLPLLAPLPLWPRFARAVRAGRYGSAFAAAALWTVLLSASVIAMTEMAPQTAGRTVLRGESYRVEMFQWIQTGVGRENEPAAFLPEHLLHLGAFALLTYLSGGYLGLALGALLVGYMSYFVGAFALSAGAPVAGALVAWVPWSVVRVAAFVALGCVLARPLLIRRAWPFGRREATWVLLASAGIALDLALKTLLAPGYGEWLRSWLAAGRGAP